MTDVPAEAATARKQRALGFALTILAIIFFCASIVLGLYDFARGVGLTQLQRLTAVIYEATQLPVLKLVWDLAPSPNFNDMLHMQNLGIFIEIIVFMVGAAMIKSAEDVLKKQFDARERVAQEQREDHFRKK